MSMVVKHAIFAIVGRRVHVLDDQGEERIFWISGNFVRTTPLLALLGAALERGSIGWTEVSCTN